MYNIHNKISTKEDVKRKIMHTHLRKDNRKKQKGRDNKPLCIAMREREKKTRIGQVTLTQCMHVCSYACSCETKSDLEKLWCGTEFDGAELAVTCLLPVYKANIPYKICCIYAQLEHILFFFLLLLYILT